MLWATCREIGDNRHLADGYERRGCVPGRNFQIMNSPFATLLLLLGSVACDVTGQVCFKLGIGHASDEAGAPSLAHKIFHSPWIARGIAVYAVEFVLWFAALSRTELSIAFPFAALGYVGVALASRFILNERISLRRWAGIGTIVVGVVLVTGQQLG
jgi:drug/metabolite transporter (DMT)-like permease